MANEHGGVSVEEARKTYDAFMKMAKVAMVITAIVVALVVVIIS